MALRPPTIADTTAIAAELGLNLGSDVETYTEMMTGLLAAYNFVDDLELTVPEVAPRTYWEPTAAENPTGGWFVKTSIKTTASGPLAGKTVGIKDSVQVAGLPFINGSNLFDDFISDVDAEVVKRILAAGGEIIGKTHCEYLCFSASSYTNARAIVHNPHRHGHTPGGSSTGSGAVVAEGSADMALGADQGGSIRIPAACCGIVGMKPTYGLVPYTGIAPIEPTLDHVGPMTRTVADNALLLQVLAGPDGIDSRQMNIQVQDYSTKLNAGIKGMRIGVVSEGMTMTGMEPAVAANVRASVSVLQRLGAIVEDVSIPAHNAGSALWVPIGMSGFATALLAGGGFGISRLDDYPIQMMRHTHSHLDGLKEAPPNIVTFLMLDALVQKQVGRALYGKAINAVRGMRAAYDDALSRYDILVMPTTPLTATPIPGPAVPLAERVRRGGEMAPNNVPFNLTHHPALSIPCGFADGLPVGLMMVGRHFDEATLYQAAAAYEATGEGLTPFKGHS